MCSTWSEKKPNIDGQPETLSSISVKKFQFSAH